MPDEWQGFPLRKDYGILEHGPTVGPGEPGNRERTISHGADTFLDSTELVLNMGPQHPSTHGVLRVILKLDGEKVIGTECVIGYLHRGVEKIARESHLRDVRALRGPHGLRGGGLERAGLLPGGRETAERGSAAARAGGARRFSRS